MEGRLLIAFALIIMLTLTILVQVRRTLSAVDELITLVGDLPDVDETPVAPPVISQRAVPHHVSLHEPEKTAPCNKAASANQPYVPSEAEFNAMRSDMARL